MQVLDFVLSITADEMKTAHDAIFGTNSSLHLLYYSFDWHAVIHSILFSAGFLGHGKWRSSQDSFVALLLKRLEYLERLAHLHQETVFAFDRFPWRNLRPINGMISIQF